MEKECKFIASNEWSENENNDRINNLHFVPYPYMPTSLRYNSFSVSDAYSPFILIFSQM